MFSLVQMCYKGIHDSLREGEDPSNWLVAPPGSTQKCYKVIDEDHPIVPIKIQKGIQIILNYLETENLNTLFADTYLDKHVFKAIFQDDYQDRRFIALAIKAGNQKMVEYLVSDTDYDPNIYWYGFNPIELAIKHDKLDILTILLKEERITSKFSPQDAFDLILKNINNSSSNLKQKLSILNTLMQKYSIEPNLKLALKTRIDSLIDLFLMESIRSKNHMLTEAFVQAIQYNSKEVIEKFITDEVISCNLLNLNLTWRGYEEYLYGKNIRSTSISPLILAIGKRKTFLYSIILNKMNRDTLRLNVNSDSNFSALSMAFVFNDIEIINFYMQNQIVDENEYVYELSKSLFCLILLKNRTLTFVFDTMKRLINKGALLDIEFSNESNHFPLFIYALKLKKPELAAYIVEQYNQHEYCRRWFDYSDNRSKLIDMRDEIIYFNAVQFLIEKNVIPLDSSCAFDYIKLDKYGSYEDTEMLQFLKFLHEKGVDITKKNEFNESLFELFLYNNRSFISSTFFILKVMKQNGVMEKEHFNKLITNYKAKFNIDIELFFEIFNFGDFGQKKELLQSIFYNERIYRMKSSQAEKILDFVISDDTLDSQTISEIILKSKPKQIFSIIGQIIYLENIENFFNIIKFLDSKNFKLSNDLYFITLLPENKQRDLFFNKLIDKKNLWNIKDSNGLNILHYLLTIGECKFINKLFHKIDQEDGMFNTNFRLITDKDSNGNNALAIFALRDEEKHPFTLEDKTIISKLLEGEVDPLSQNINGESAIDIINKKPDGHFKSMFIEVINDFLSPKSGEKRTADITEVSSKKARKDVSDPLKAKGRR